MFQVLNYFMAAIRVRESGLPQKCNRVQFFKLQCTYLSVEEHFPFCYLYFNGMVTVSGSVKMMRLMTDFRLRYRRSVYLVNRQCRKLCRRIIKSQPFYWLVIIMVFLNTCMLTSEHHLQPLWLDKLQGSYSTYGLVNTAFAAYVSWVHRTWRKELIWCKVLSMYNWKFYRISPEPSQTSI